MPAFAGMTTQPRRRWLGDSGLAAPPSELVFAETPYYSVVLGRPWERLGNSSAKSPAGGSAAGPPGPTACFAAGRLSPSGPGTPAPAPPGRSVGPVPETSP